MSKLRQTKIVTKKSGALTTTLWTCTKGKNNRMYWFKQGKRVKLSDVPLKIRSTIACGKRKILKEKKPKDKPYNVIAKNGATFWYYNGKRISAKKAIELRERSEKITSYFKAK